MYDIFIFVLELAVCENVKLIVAKIKTNKQTKPGLKSLSSNFHLKVWCTYDWDSASPHPFYEWEFRARRKPFCVQFSLKWHLWWAETLLNYFEILEVSNLAARLLERKKVLIISISELLLISICVEYPNHTNKGCETLACGGAESKRDCFSLDYYQSYFPQCRSILLCVGMFYVHTVRWMSHSENFLKYTFFSAYLKNLQLNKILCHDLFRNLKRPSAIWESFAHSAGPPIIQGKS